MSEEALDRLESVADEIAQNNGAGVQVFEQADGSWIVSIEPIGDAQGTWVVRGEGPTKAMALNNLVRNAQKQGLA